MDWLFIYFCEVDYKKTTVNKHPQRVAYIITRTHIYAEKIY